MIKLPVRERMKEFESFNEWQFGQSTKVNFISFELCNSSPSRERKWYEDIVYLPFENMQVPAPIGYEQILKCQYGDYNKFVRGGSAHEGICLDPDTPYYLYKR
jgi:lipopolysaccharide cholinephosphotransferase